MPRILMFAAAFAPACFSEGLVNSKLALAMKESGWDLEVISMVSDKATCYQSGWLPPWLPLKPILHQVETRIAKERGWRFPNLALDVLATGHLVKGVHWSRLAYRKAIELQTVKPFDLVISRSTSCCSHLPAILFKKATGVQWVANWNDPPPYLFPPPYTHAMPKCRRLMVRRYLRAAARMADYNTFPNRHLFLHLRIELGITDEKRLRIIPHIAFVGHKAIPWKRCDSLRLCHAGNLSAARRPETFLRAFKRVAERYKGRVKMTFDIIGTEEVNLRTITHDLGLDENVCFHGTKSFLDTLDLIARADVAVLIEAPCDKGIFLPSKIIDYAQTGRPILSISPKTGVMRDLLAELGGGIHADNLSQPDIEVALERIAQLWLKNRLDKLDPNRWVQEASVEAVLSAFKSMMPPSFATRRPVGIPNMNP